MRKMQRVFPGICGILAPIIAFVVISLSIHMHPWFSWKENALSDLGALGVPCNTIFNIGLIFTAIFSFPFAFGISETIQNKISRTGVLFFVISIIFLLGIGVFPEGTSFHETISIAFYIFVVLSLLLIGAGLIKNPSERKYGLFTLLIIFTGIFLSFGFSWPAIAVPESIGAGTVGIWSIVFGFRILHE